MVHALVFSFQKQNSWPLHLKWGEGFCVVLFCFGLMVQRVQSMNGQQLQGRSGMVEAYGGGKLLSSRCNEEGRREEPRKETYPPKTYPQWSSSFNQAPHPSSTFICGVIKRSIHLWIHHPIIQLYSKSLIFTHMKHWGYTTTLCIFIHYI